MTKKITLLIAAVLFVNIVRGQLAPNIKAEVSASRISGAQALVDGYLQGKSPSLDDQTIAQAIKADFLKQFSLPGTKPAAAPTPVENALNNTDQAMKAKLEKEFPMPTDEEFQKMAEEEYPLYKLGEKIKVVYMGPNHDVPNKVEGYFRGVFGPSIKVGGFTVRIQDMKAVQGHEKELLKFDKDATEAKRKDFIARKRDEINTSRVNYLKANRDSMTDLLAEDIATENEKLGYTYVDGKWLDVDQLLVYASRQAKLSYQQKTVAARRNEINKKVELLDRQLESIIVNLNVTPPGERVTPSKLMAKEDAERKRQEELALKKQKQLELAKAREEAMAKAKEEAEAKEKAEMETKVQESPEPEPEQPAPPSTPVAPVVAPAPAPAPQQIMGVPLKHILVAVLVVVLAVVAFVCYRFRLNQHDADRFKKYFEGKGQLQKDFWSAATADPENFKYVAYMFPSLKEATMALTKLSFITMNSMGELKCTKNLRLGVYPHLEGAVCFVGGPNFHYALWREASAILPELPNATYFKVSTEPKVKLELPDLDKLNAITHAHIENLGTEDIESETGEFIRLFKYKTDYMEAALKFLDTITIEEEGIIVHVQTPEGVVGKDENGVFSLDDDDDASEQK